jgi:hypothetical protein
MGLGGDQKWFGSYKSAAESNQNSQGDRDGVKSGDLHGVKKREALSIF